MTNSTVDRKQILQMKDRAIGHQFGMSYLPAVSPRLGAAGTYSTARDLGRFVQFHLNHGTLEGRRILNTALVDSLLAPRWTLQEPDVFLAFGLYLDKRNPVTFQESITPGFMALFDGNNGAFLQADFGTQSFPPWTVYQLPEG